MRPLIGVGTSSRDGYHRQRHEYAEAIATAGGTPVLLPVVHAAEAEAEAEVLADRLDGLVVPGGPGITRGLTGALPADLVATPSDRSGFDEAVARAFLQNGKPILGICYGMQLLNALDGGTIYGDVQRDVEGALVHSHERGATSHPIAVVPESNLAKLLADVEVNTRHIQAVRDVGPSYRIGARAPDGVVEAIESPDGRIIGVQFHPERLGEAGLPLFRHLVSTARVPLQ